MKGGARIEPWDGAEGPSHIGDRPGAFDALVMAAKARRSRKPGIQKWRLRLAEWNFSARCVEPTARWFNGRFNKEVPAAQAFLAPVEPLNP
jgi:hypothetical protein